MAIKISLMQHADMFNSSLIPFNSLQLVSDLRHALQIEGILDSHYSPIQTYTDGCVCVRMFIMYRVYARIGNTRPWNHTQSRCSCRNPTHKIVTCGRI